MANNSPQAKKMAKLQAMADNHSAQKMLPIQKKAVAATPAAEAPISEAVGKNTTGLPDNLKNGMEILSGMPLNDVKVHRNSDKPAQLHAHAYAQGTDIHLGAGQEKHLPHEAWHVVQQKQGRVNPTMQMKGKVNVNDDAGLEKEADVMGARALAPVAQRIGVSEKVELLKGKFVPVQRKGGPVEGVVREKFATASFSGFDISDVRVGDWQKRSGEGSSHAAVVQRAAIADLKVGVDVSFPHETKSNNGELIPSHTVGKVRGLSKSKKSVKVEITRSGAEDTWLVGTEVMVSPANVELGIMPTKVNAPAHAKLKGYDRINLIDLGGPGSGHQAAVLKLLESVADVGYNNTVYLTYKSSKTRIYARKFGKAAELDDPVQSWALYHEEWDGVFPEGAAPEKQVRIRCRPQVPVTIPRSNAEERMFKDAREFWTQHAWPGAAPAAFEEDDPGGFGSKKANWAAKKKWSASNDTLQAAQTAFRAAIDKLETGAEMVPMDQVPALPDAAPNALPTLTAFGAMDMHADVGEDIDAPEFAQNYFENHWLQKLREMTGEDDPVAIIMQPFLWTKGHAMQTRGGGGPTVDITRAVAEKGGEAAYRWQAPKPENDAAVIAKQPAIVQGILNKAKAKEIHLVSAYYGGAVSNITYPNLLKVLVRVFKEVSDQKKVVIALLGNEEETAHTDVARDINQPDVGAKTPDVPNDTLNIQLAHIGRTTAMTQFERYSELFITEGANTWQETLTIGTPTLSAMPNGNTQPWDSGSKTPEAKAAALKVKNASQALIAAQGQGDTQAAINTLAAFVREVREERSDINRYFKEWSTLLGRTTSDQVLTALTNLPNAVAVPKAVKAQGGKGKGRKGKKGKKGKAKRK